MAKFIDLDSSGGGSRYFFKVFFADQSTHQLRIPPAFREHIEAESSQKVILKGPSGSLWKVSLVKKSYELFFQDGWKEFVSDQSLNTGDFLVFQYHGNSCFSVLVFDNSACEKKEAFTARMSTEECLDVEGSEELIKKETLEEEETPVFPKETRFHGRRKIDDLLPSKGPLLKNKRASQSDSDGPELKSNSSSSSKRAHVSPDSTALASEKQKFHSQSSCSQSSRGGLKLMTGKNVNVMKSDQITEIIKKAKSEFESNKVSTSGPQPSKGNTEKKPRKAWEMIRTKLSQDRGDGSSGLRIGGLISQRRPITEEEMNTALLKSMTFKSKHPFAFSVMREAYVYSSFFMSLPSWFAKQYLPKENTVLTLSDPNDRQWEVNYISYVTRGALSAGWCKVTYANNLEKYDVCVFELIEKNHLRMHIFRVVDQITPLLRRSAKRELKESITKVRGLLAKDAKRNIDDQQPVDIQPPNQL